MVLLYFKLTERNFVFLCSDHTEGRREGMKTEENQQSCLQQPPSSTPFGQSHVLINMQKNLIKKTLWLNIFNTFTTRIYAIFPPWNNLLREIERKWSKNISNSKNVMKINNTNIPFLTPTFIIITFDFIYQKKSRSPS